VYAWELSEGIEPRDWIAIGEEERVDDDDYDIDEFSEQSLNSELAQFFDDDDDAEAER